MSDKRISNQEQGAFIIGCMTISVAAIFLAVAIAIFFGIGWGFAAFALFVFALGLLFCISAIQSTRQKQRARMPTGIDFMRREGRKDDCD